MEPLEVIKVRAERVGFAVSDREIEIYDVENDRAIKGKAIELAIPNGRTPRVVLISERQAPLINDADFENWIFLGEYAAILDTKTGVIEALLRGYGAPPVTFTLRRLAESQAKQAKQASSPDEVIEVDVAEGVEQPLSIRFSGESDRANRISAEICDASRALTVADRGVAINHFSLRISTNGLRNHDQALRFLKEFSTALFLELDLTWQVTLGLQVSQAVMRTRRSRQRRGPVDVRPPRLPRMQYSQEAASLYTYGRSATGMPLLEFLAYYQVMEFYFPIYAKREVMQRARQELLDPRFDATNDSHLARVLGILGGGPRGFLAESEQLRATLRNCTDEESLKEFIQQDPDVEQFLTGKQEIRGVRSLNFNNRDQRLSDQVADRLYQIRCRIVHSKDDGGGSGTELLLPFGEEARKLATDISLARYVAQKVLIAGAHSATWG
ncbi:hypothetical protein [Micromonospora chersina]|uniref:hypothetical protein n=1 Tax=Micromonospora chersina TaxID=47854 RepID=UPI003710AAA0